MAGRGAPGSPGGPTRRAARFFARHPRTGVGEAGRVAAKHFHIGHQVVAKGHGLGRLQVGEFSMIIGLIKRAQSQLGGLFCVSGVIGCFRRSALHAVGYWNPERLTEDIDVTWELQRAGWRVRYEPHALIWILMPETLQGLWRQRLRWAEGGLQVLRAHLDLLWTPRQWLLLPLLLEPLASLAWAHLLALMLPLALMVSLASLLELPQAWLPAGWVPAGMPPGAWLPLRELQP